MRGESGSWAIKWNNFDSAMLVLLGIMVAFGLLSVYSSSYPLAIAKGYPGYFYVARQACFAAFGVALMIGGMFSPPRVLRHLSPWFLLLCIVMLILTPIFGCGSAKRWISVGPLTLQASEWAKVALILYGSHFISRNKHALKTNFFGTTFFLLTVVMLIVALVMSQPHLSGALIILAAGAILCWFGGIPTRHLVICAIIIALFMPAGIVLFAKPYQIQRILNYFNPHEDPLGRDYQQIHARNAFIRGGLFGRGFCDGREKQLYLPAAPTDFPLATIAEECGLISTLSVLAFYMVLTFYGFGVARSCCSHFGKVLSASITTLIVGQAALSIAVNMGKLPTTGIPLPLISYGGNSLAATLLALGLLFNMSLHDRTSDTMEAKAQNEWGTNDSYGSWGDRRAYLSSHSRLRGAKKAQCRDKHSVRWRIAGA